MVACCPTELIHGGCYLSLRSIAPHIAVNVKLEGFSVSGSIKVKPAVHMVRQLEAAGRLGPGARLIESSSGNLGLALSMICAAKGYAFTCVSDPNIAPLTARAIRAYGAELVIVRDRDPSGGYLGTRIDLIKAMLDRDPRLVWINQYENLENVRAHQLTTGPELLARFPRPDYVFVGAGTTGTLGGVSAALREWSPSTRIVAVDSAGSVTFGRPAGKRHIPGLGTSRKPPISRLSSFDELLMVPEADTIAMCRRLARDGVLLGGSSGTVLAGVRSFAAAIPPGSCVVAISPDLGERYLDTIYNDEWVEHHFPGLLPALLPCPLPGPVTGTEQLAKEPA
ncbi:2,3-diaminopropionate biosynthesis protein SbnA [Azospirillum agricola]|uniref:2,3-diaminopropionate biosynthesis protein SbnA n=1 Tax=Azospirillum agricola TaxID=1720247 RepID=UPI000A0EFFBE|nr:2,3-diaminopropionate biosynthesis protein SbnA [Azospirillum agricola]SMH39469.1 cysteine synthase A [Azospirillum lipoferum]